MTQTTEKTVLVSVQNLHKRYGDLAAVRGLSFDIFQGEVFGLLGPNGAGKTTTIEIIEGLRQADSGSVRVCGLDPAQESMSLKERIGAQLQSTVLPDKMRVDEALRLFAGFYRRSASVETLLESSASWRSVTLTSRSFPAGKSSAWRSPWRW